MNKLRFLLVLFLINIAFLAFSDRNVKQDLISAEEYYKNSQYEKSAEIYEKIIKENGSSASILFNLGNTYYRLGDNGKAMLYYKKAQRLDSHNKSINNNIKFLSDKILDSNIAEAKNDKGLVMPDNKPFFAWLSDYLFISISSNIWAIISAIAFIIFILGLSAYIFSSKIILRKSGFFSAIAFFIISVITISFSFVSKSKSETSQEGVVMAFKINLRKAPDSKSKEISTPLCRGTVLDVLKVKNGENADSNWYYVRLNDRFEGWVDEKNFEII